MPTHPTKFVRFCDLGNSDCDILFRRAAALKGRRARGAERRTLEGRTLAMLFEKPSTRTRVSFEAGMAQLGGHALSLSQADSQMSRGESPEDTAKVLSSMCDAIMARASSHSTVERLAAASSVPVINGLSDAEHPCQVLADLFTVVELRGGLDGLRALWVGDPNNVCRSWIAAAGHLGFELAVACPAQLAGAAGISSAGNVTVTHDALAAARRGAHAVVTDVWFSMGDKDDADKRCLLEPYRVTRELMAAAGGQAWFMHCLPAHRGEEVEAEVIDGPHSAVWAEAENRMHAQKALLELLILGELPAEGDA